MKTQLVVFFFFFSLIKLYGSEVSEDTLLNNIQHKIEAAAGTLIQHKNASDLRTLEEKLAEIKGDAMARYWHVYALLFEAQCHHELKNKKACYEKVKQGLKAMKRIKTMGSEEYVLLASLQSMSMDFMGNASAAAGIMNATVKTNIEKALELDQENLRAWVVRGLQSYYTPKFFGGGKLVEESFTKAITLREESATMPNGPSWGKPTAYDYLIAFYMDTHRVEEAKKLLEEGLKKYPEDYLLKKREKTLTEK